VHDWKEIVRRRLTPLPLEPGRREEVIEELSHQLEDAYKEALSAGASEPAALRRSLVQFNDWENLRKDVFRAVKAEELPVWQQRGILSPKRPWVWATLVLSLALLTLSGFRQSLTTLSVPFNTDPWEESFFSTRTLGQMQLFANNMDGTPPLFRYRGGPSLAHAKSFCCSQVRHLCDPAF
jgi:hypothetical protein